MNKIFTSILFLVFIISAAEAQVVQSNYTGVIVPQYICSGGSTRLPYVFRATVSGLLANSTYRYYSNACRYTDFGGTNSGAGNPIFINGSTFRYSTATGLSTAGGYDSLLTDGSGNYTGWFGFVNTGNARFTPGNYVYPTITLDSVGNGSTKFRFALNDSMLVLGFADTGSTVSGTGLYGISLATPKNIITVYDNINNAGRPLSMVYVESDGIDTTQMTSLVQYYKDSVDSRNGRWGTVVPNSLSNGVRRVNVLQLDNAAIANYQVDNDGIWPSGLNTINPNGGAVNPLRMNQLDVPLTVKNVNSVPGNFTLNQNYPNPFNPSTVINFAIPSSGLVKLKVFDILGKEVSELVNGMYNTGSYDVYFSAGGLQSGVYFYSLDFTGENGNYFSDRKKLVLVK